MKTLKFNLFAALFTAAILVCSLVPLSSCKVLPYEKIGSKGDFLCAEGADVKNADGETVYLRGINAGGLFVTEHWMTGFTYGTKPNNDNKSLSRIFIDRFGEEKTQNLWKEYRANWWTDADFANCAEAGFNVIRLPFTYMTVDFAAVTDYGKAGNRYDFSALDAFVKRAAEYGMYTILDLHGAYGSQNGQDHSGEILDYRNVDFYSNEQMQTLTVKLWKALSEHYKNNAAVAGYDILNEPGERGASGVLSTEKRHWDFFDKVYDAIRENGDNHIIIFESCWEGSNLPRPSKYGWENCMYSFHHYAGNKLTEEEYRKNWEIKIESIEAMNFGIPLQMGEFTNYSSAENWEYVLGLMNSRNWHWVSWTYKVWGSMPWGIVNVFGDRQYVYDSEGEVVETIELDRVNAATDKYEDILIKFRSLRTDNQNSEEYTFYIKDESGKRVPYKTLKEIYKAYCAPAQNGKETHK